MATNSTVDLRDDLQLHLFLVWKYGGAKSSFKLMSISRKYPAIHFQQLTTSSEGMLLGKISTWMDTVSTILFLLESRSSSKIKIVFPRYLLVRNGMSFKTSTYFRFQKVLENKVFFFVLFKYIKHCVLRLLNFIKQIKKLELMGWTKVDSFIFQKGKYHHFPNSLRKNKSQQQKEELHNLKRIYPFLLTLTILPLYLSFLPWTVKAVH